MLNKCDLVDEEWLEMMEEDVREELSGTFLEHAPLDQEYRQRQVPALMIW